MERLGLKGEGIENLEEIERASFEAKKISVMGSPREKFRCLQMMVAILKSKECGRVIG